MEERKLKNGSEYTEPTALKKESVEHALWRLSVILSEISRNIMSSENIIEPHLQSISEVRNNLCDKLSTQFGRQL